MNKILTTCTVAALSACLLAGCASFGGHGLQPGVASANEVRAVMGEPERVCDLSQQGKRLVYPRGPMGRATFVADIGADDILQSIENTLAPEGIAKLRIGNDTEQDVLCWLGSPWRKIRFSDSVVWYYSIRDGFGYGAQLAVEFGEDGVVRDMVEIRENIGSDSRQHSMLGGRDHVPTPY